MWESRLSCHFKLVGVESKNIDHFFLLTISKGFFSEQLPGISKNLSQLILRILCGETKDIPCFHWLIYNPDPNYTLFFLEQEIWMSWYLALVGFETKDIHIYRLIVLKLYFFRQLPSKSENPCKLIFSVIWESLVVRQRISLVFIDSFTTLSLTLPFFNVRE